MFFALLRQPTSEIMPPPKGNLVQRIDPTRQTRAQETCHRDPTLPNMAYALYIGQNNKKLGDLIHSERWRSWNGDL